MSDPRSAAPSREESHEDDADRDEKTERPSTPAPIVRRPLLSKRQKIWGAVALVGIAGLSLMWITRDKEEDKTPRVPRGRPVCPPTAAPTAGLRPGDYAILVLEDRDSTFEEPAWGQVLSRSPDGDAFLVRLLGTTGDVGAVQLAKDKHGFRVGDMLKVEASCVWDTMAQPDTGGKGQLFCGFAGADLIGEDPVHVPELAERDEVKVIASTLIGSQAHADELWVKVDGLSRTGNVVYGTIISTIHFPMHGFRQWQEIQFSRDCIFDARRP